MYGVVFPHFVADMVARGRLGRGGVLVDVGSGVGNVVLQVRLSLSFSLSLSLSLSLSFSLSSLPTLSLTKTVVPQVVLTVGCRALGVEIEETRYGVSRELCDAFRYAWG